jgi:1-acylglycerone phosphate reductase
MHWYVRTFLNGTVDLKGGLGPITDVTDAQAAQAFDINVLALLRLSRAVVPHMVARKTGRIVAIGSIAGEL